MFPALPVNAPGPLLLYSIKVIAAGQETDVVDLHNEAALHKLVQQTAVRHTLRR